MSAAQPEVVTRKDLCVMFQYGAWKAGKLFNTILATVPKEKMRPEFKRRLPRHYVDAYLNKYYFNSSCI